MTLQACALTRTGGAIFSSLTKYYTVILMAGSQTYMFEDVHTIPRKLQQEIKAMWTLVLKNGYLGK
jgi:hypothetical protein